MQLQHIVVQPGWVLLLQLLFPLGVVSFSAFASLHNKMTPEKTWEPQAADDIIERLRTKVTVTTSTPFMVALVGIPGSGKSTSAHLVAEELSTRHGKTPMIMPHDGYHIALAELPNADAIYRRGAPDTFDVDALIIDLKRIKYGGIDEPTISVPGFDHAIGDPTPSAHTFDRARHDIVICEGLYLLHDSNGWERMKQEFDVSIYIDSNVDRCIERLKVRNSVIPGYTLEELLLRCDAVDRVNAMTVQRSSAHRADLVVISYDEHPTVSRSGTTGLSSSQVE